MKRHKVNYSFQVSPLRIENFDLTPGRKVWAITALFKETGTNERKEKSLWMIDFLEILSL